ncbi:MAG: REP-associated tyrosine transposase [Acidobacteriaceae bacterium]
MPTGLKRFYGAGDLHFLTFSCGQRRPYLQTPDARNHFLAAFERVRQRHQFSVIGYVVMPEHVHLLITEPETGTPSAIMQVLEQTSSRKLKSTVGIGGESFWQIRFYDFNVRTEKKRVEKLKYMHRNPVTRGLVALPEQWEWSSFRHYLLGEPGQVEIDTRWSMPWKPE